MIRTVNTERALLMQQLTGDFDTDKYRYAIRPKCTHLNTIAALNTVELQAGETLELSGKLLTKVVMFSTSRPFFLRITRGADRYYSCSYDGAYGLYYFEDSLPDSTEWCIENTTWSGGKYPSPIPENFFQTLGDRMPTHKYTITAVALTHVVYEFVMSNQVIGPPETYSSFGHSLHYDPSDYEPSVPLPHNSSVLELHNSMGPVTSRIIDTLVWKDDIISAQLHYNGVPCVHINGWTRPRRWMSGIHDRCAECTHVRDGQLAHCDHTAPRLDLCLLLETEIPPRFFLYFTRMFLQSPEPRFFHK